MQISFTIGLIDCDMGLSQVWKAFSLFQCIRTRKWHLDNHASKTSPVADSTIEQQLGSYM